MKVKLLFLFLLLLLIPSLSFAASLAWDAPTNFTNGDPVPPGTITKYTIYRSDALSGPLTKLTDTPNLTFPLDESDKGKFFHVTASYSGGESQPASIQWLPSGKVINIRIEGTLTILP